MSKVVLLKCADYDEKSVAEKVKKIFRLSPLNVEKGQTVFLKANLLLGKKPEEAVTTHPAVIKAVALYFLEKGCKVIIGDSPGGVFNAAYLKTVYRITGMQEAAKAVGCELNYNTDTIEIGFAEGKKIKTMNVVKAMAAADILISMAKLKTHGMMAYTGAMKNMFGAIPGVEKIQYHLRMPEYNDFADTLLDICFAMKPAYAIIDGIVGMEGDGPSGGKSRKAGVLLGGADLPALDRVGAALIGLDAKEVPMLNAACKRGLLKADEFPEILGDDFAEVCIKDFVKSKSAAINMYADKLPKFIVKWLDKRLKAYPVFNGVSCNGCGLCAQNCPMKIIEIKNKRPMANLSTCVSCFCCHELCPQKAINIKRGVIARIFLRN